MRHKTWKLDFKVRVPGKSTITLQGKAAGPAKTLMWFTRTTPEVCLVGLWIGKGRKPKQRFPHFAGRALQLPLTAFDSRLPWSAHRVPVSCVKGDTFTLQIENTSKSVRRLKLLLIGSSPKRMPKEVTNAA